MSRQGPQARRTTQPGHTQRACTRGWDAHVTKLFALCRNKDLRVATWFPGMLGGLGRDIVFLYRDKDFWPCVATKNLCRDRIWGLARVLWVSTRVSLYHDRVFPRVGHSFRDRRLYVTTRFLRVVLR